MSTPVLDEPGLAPRNRSKASGMNRRGASKVSGSRNGATDRAATDSPLRPLPVVASALPRSGNRVLLAVSGVCFFVWLGVLAWLAYC